jgi:general secretion pathway protein G
MVVVVIMSILALGIVPRVIDRPDQARVARAKSDIAVLDSALKLYRLDNNAYPTTEQGLAALVEKPASGPAPANWAANGYVERLPTDPWGAAYQYLAPGVHGDYDVFSYGADGAAGGSGVDADIGNWTPG